MGEVVEQKKKEKADLIYVYNESDLDELKQIKEVYDILSNQTKDNVDDDIFDRTETDEQLENQILKSLDNSKTNEEKNNKLEDVDFDWDDI